MSYGSTEHGEAHYGGEAGAGHIDPIADTLHVTAHIVEARPPHLSADTLHVTAHIVSAKAPLFAGTLHVSVHTIAARAPRNAQTLHVAAHLVHVRSPVYAGTLHIESRIVHADVVTTHLRLTLELIARNSLDHVLSTLDGSHDRNFQDQLSDTGSGQLVVDNDDPDAAALTIDRLVRFKIANVPAWCMLIEQRQITAATEGEEHDEVTVVSGRGHLAVMEEGVVYPTFGVGHRPIEEDRYFDWTSPPSVYDDTSWGPPNVLGTYTPGDTGSVLGYPLNEWPDAAAQHITTNLFDPAGTPSGYVYFRKTFTLASPVFMTVLVHGDDRTRVFVDGVFLMSSENNGLEGEPSPYRAPRQSIHLDAGDHVIAVELVNYWITAGFPLEWGPFDGASVTYPPNLATLILTGMEQLGNGTFGSVILHTDNTWKMVEYPSAPPGMTPGQVLRILLSEAQARGALLEVSLGFGDVYDSNGNPWGFIDFSTKVGTDYLTVLKEMAESYIDVWMDPSSLVLHATTKGTRAGASGVTLHTPTNPDDPTSGNLTELAYAETV